MNDATKESQMATLPNVLADMESIVARVLGFVSHRPQDRDDLSQVARIAIWEASVEFDANRRVPLTAFQYQRARWAVLEALRSSGWVRRRAYERGVRVSLSNDPRGFSETDPHFEARQESVTLLSELRPEFDSMSVEERTLLSEHYASDRRFDHTAEDLGISKSWASRLHGRALRRLRDFADGSPAESMAS